MNLKDKAKDRPEVLLARQSSPGAYVIQSLELSGADELTEEGDFPQYGDFLKCHRAGTEKLVWVECPAALARFLVNEIDAEVGTCFRVRSVTKVDGEWEYNAEQVEVEEGDDGLTLAEAAGDD